MQRVVLDACVLYPAALRDILLRCAEARFFAPIWSERILSEMLSALSRNRPDIPQERLVRLQELMSAAFPEAWVEIDRLTAQLPDPDDSHVVAAAIASHASTIVTLNVRHFPQSTVDVHTRAIVMTPDQFLLQLLGEDPEAMVMVVLRAASALRNPPLSPRELLGVVALHAPGYCAHVTELLAADS
ncbi:MAG: PIN domain-containing protein [Actinobacteria bacterium HGW-Actinobacteria-7]|jgi:predicted nucleic acid-binding protein|nr:MAG: PIN domain-containing protein [Actinobacteria bacterium HGW-Actinobacteria-7]